MLKSIQKLTYGLISSFTLISTKAYAGEPTTTNPYVNELVKMIDEFKVWGLVIIGAVTVAKIVQHGIKYQSGTTDEKQDAVKSIRNTLVMGGGIFFLVWLATYIMTRFYNITP